MILSNRPAPNMYDLHVECSNVSFGAITDGQDEASSVQGLFSVNILAVDTMSNRIGKNERPTYLSPSKVVHSCASYSLCVKLNAPRVIEKP